MGLQLKKKKQKKNNNNKKKTLVMKLHLTSFIKSCFTSAKKLV